MPGRAPADIPRVSARAAAPPGAPDCPACTEPMFPWLDGTGDAVAVDRCENCGLAMCKGGTGTASVAAEATLTGAATDSGTYEVDNAASLQALVGAERWAGLDRTPGAVNLSRDSARLILEARGSGAVSVRPSVSRSIATMWQTLLNLVTFERNFAPEAISGRLRPTGAGGRVRFAIDAAITILAGIPVAIVAVLIEGGAVAVGRGGAVRFGPQ